jgi:hypothetical protein
VLKRWPDRTPLVAKARFGLGILNENRFAFDKNPDDVDAARQEYDYVVKHSDASSMLHLEAQRRLKELPAWAKGVKFATTTQAASSPATATAPASAPAALTSPAGTK